MRVALYARKSTESEDRQVQSLDDQIRELTKLALHESLEITEVIQESKSAKVPNSRPEFARLLDQIDDGSIDGILTWSINRLSRNPVDGGQIAYLLQTGKLSLIRTIERAYRPEDNALLLSIENGMATAYLQDLSRNVKRGMRGKVQRGWHSNKAPVGYKNDAETRQVVIDEERFTIMRHAFDMVLSGEYAMRHVHKEVVSRGLTVLSRHGDIRAISYSGLYLAMRNPFYKGQIKFKGEDFPGKHVPMVTEVEYLQAQANISRKLRFKKQLDHSFPFTNVFRCAKCGCAVVGEKRVKSFPNTRRTVEYIYYHCTGSKGCPKPVISQQDIVKRFEKISRQVMVSTSFGEWLKSALFDSVERESVEDMQALAERKFDLATHQKRLETLSVMRIDGEISQAEFSSLRSTILDQIGSLKATITSFENSSARILRKAYEFVDIAIKARELEGGDNDPFALGAFARKVGEHAIHLTDMIIDIHPVLQKIISFEPLRNGSQSPKRDDFVPLNSIWWSLVSDILNLVRDEDLREIGVSTQIQVDHKYPVDNGPAFSTSSE